ncbi:MAG: four helix bundle protein [Chitinophagales bacterium]|nr:four helix bundle protein [Chitinophagales bacterium]
MKENEIVKLSFNFALETISYCEILEENRKYVIARQLLRSGTSIGANVREAQNCESRADFIHKLKIAAKEAEETDYWISLCKYSASYPNVALLETQITSILKLLNKIISTLKKREKS